MEGVNVGVELSWKVYEWEEEKEDWSEGRRKKREREDVLHAFAWERGEERKGGKGTPAGARERR